MVAAGRWKMAVTKRQRAADVRPLCEVWWEGIWEMREAVSEDVSLAGLPSGGRISNISPSVATTLQRGAASDNESRWGFAMPCSSVGVRRRR